MTAPEFVPGEILVKFKSGVSAQSTATFFSSSGLETVQHFATLGVHRCRIPAGMDIQQAIAVTEQDPAVEYAEPNYIYRASKVPNDPRFAELWGLANTADTDVDAPEAWDVQTGLPATLVAVIDTGVDYTHEDLQANMWRNPGESGRGRDTNGVDDDGNGLVDDVFGWDFAGDDRDPMDDNGHGTHVAGTIAAVGDNQIGVTGVSWRASIMALKFLSADGSGSAADAIESIVYAATHGARVLNNSWGGAGFSRALQEAIELARDRNAVFVAAAGNESRDNDVLPTYPAAYDVANVLSVAAYDPQGQLASFSNSGKTSVDLAAPGVDVLSTVPGNAYRAFSGTSMATPHTSGVAALLYGQQPDVGYREVLVRVAGGVEPSAALENATWSGGRLNAAAALAPGLKLAFVTRLSNIIDPAGPYLVQAETASDTVLASVALTYTVAGGATATLPMTEIAAGVHRADLPGQPLGSSVSYFVEATDTAGSVARSRTYTFQVGQNAGVPGCGGFEFRTTGGIRNPVLAWILNGLLLAAALFGARKIVVWRRGVALHARTLHDHAAPAHK